MEYRPTHLLSAVCLLLLSSMGFVAQDAPTFRSSVQVLTVHALVQDERGRPITGLQPSDFTVLDNGFRRPIVRFEGDENAPATVAFLVDVSGSMAGEHGALAQAFLDHTLDAMRAGEDEAALFTFDTRLQPRHEFTTDLAQARRALPKGEAFGSTSLYDAVAQTAEDINATRRAALVVVTDGRDTASDLTAGEVSAIASSVDVPVYVVVTSAEGNDPERERPGTDVGDLAQWSGGNVLRARSGQEAQQAATLVYELRHQYVLGITPSSFDGWRRLTVQVRAKNARVRARSGYFGGQRPS